MIIINKAKLSADVKDLHLCFRFSFGKWLQRNITQEEWSTQLVGPW